MFGKKLLSVVGLLFLGSQIISVEAVCAPTLNESNDVCNALGCEESDAGNHYLANNGQGGKDYIVVIGAKGESCNIEEEGECGVNVAGDVCTVTNCGLEYNEKLFINDGKLYEVTVVLNEETGQITRTCAPKDLTGNLCVANDGGRAMTNIDAFCEGVTCTSYVCTDGECTPEVESRDCQRTLCQWDAEKGFTGCANGDYLIVEETAGGVIVGLIEGSMKDSGSNNAKLYSCSEHSEETHSKRGNVVSCEAVKGSIEVGYYKNAGSIKSPYIQCNSSGCSPVDLSVEKENDICDGENNGELFFNKVVKICLDKNKSLTLLEGNFIGQYFMSMKKANLFDKDDHENLYAALDVTAKEIHIHKETNLGKDGSSLEMYKFTNAGYKIQSRSSGICTQIQTIVEFKLETCSASPDDVAYYSKVKEYSF